MSEQRLLILDDDELTGKTISNIAEFAGMKTCICQTSVDFFQKLEHWQPSHIAVDLIMPDMDGVEVLVELANRKTSAGVIITSGVGHRILEAAARSASEHGLNILGTLPKPFNPRRFRELVNIDFKAAFRNTRSADLQPRAVRSVNEDDLRTAIHQGNISVVYQPKIECHGGKLTGFEALARWEHPEKGLIPPDLFIGMAEAQGLIDSLTILVFEQALPWFNQFLQQIAGYHNLPTSNDLHLSVNISARSLLNAELFEHIHELCSNNGLDSHQIMLELTETGAMDDPVASLDMLTRLRMRGFHLSIDDFGTGFSSMVQLVRMPFSEVKIDKSFVMTAHTSRESRLVIKAIIELAHSLGLQATAEGIEDMQTLQFLQELNCDHAQGYMLGRPAQGDTFIDWLQQRHQEIEKQRLQALKGSKLLDTPAEERFDRITRLAKRLFKVPITLISLVDENRQWFKSKTGLTVCETSREVAFCSYAIEQDGLFLVEDASRDSRFADNPLVTGPPFIRFYAGYPVAAPTGEKLGTLCLIDHVNRKFTQREADTLQELATMVEEEIATNQLLSEDHLTGLLNRRGFEGRAGHVLQLCQRQQMVTSLVYIDLDNFKQINDRQGHQAGDDALIQFARTLSMTFRDSDLIARIGGDEFVVMLINQDAADIPAIMQRLQSTVQAYNDKVNPELHLSYSYGLASAETDSEYSLQQLYAVADEAMYRNKRQSSTDKPR